MNHLFKISIFLIAALSELPAQEKPHPYGWPLTIHNGISSSFQEFRSSHFHTGIDLRTLQMTGFPVLAISDGVIERISVSNRNYGRWLRIRNNDGKFSEYGHLERFRDDIEAIVAREQASRGEKYFGAYVLAQPLAVCRGDVIAFSGESGAGFPHLHLEIRDGTDQAINPLRLIVPSEDGNEPRIQGLLVRSRGGSLVNGDCGEFYFKFRKKGSTYTLDKPLMIDGACDITLHAYDLSDSGHVVAPERLEARLDGRPVFKIDFDRLSRDDNNQLGMLYDMAYSTPGTYYFNLCSQTGFLMEKTGARLADELLLLQPGLHEIQVVVKDRQQNQALAFIPILKVSATSSGRSEKKHHQEAVGNGLMQRVEISTFVNHDDVMVKMKDFPAPAAQLKLKVMQGNQEATVQAREYADGVYFSFKPLNHEMNMRMRFELSAGGFPVEVLQKILQVVLIENNYAQTVRFHDFTAEFGPTSVREPATLLLEQVALFPEYPLLAGPVRSEPVHFAFLDAVYFKFKFPAGTERLEQLGIFKYQAARRKWKYVPSRLDPGSEYVNCRVLTAGTFALLRDIYPPSIRLGRPASRHLQRLKKLVVRISDKGKGINMDSVAVFLNGQKLDAEYDPDWGHVLLENLPGLKKGRNDLLVQVEDWGGNLSKSSFLFFLQ